MRLKKIEGTNNQIKVTEHQICLSALKSKGIALSF